MKLRCFSPSLPVKGLRVFVRVDWNVPLSVGLKAHDSLKLERSYPLLRELHAAGAITIAMTHFGRPKKREVKYSTKPFARIVSAHSGLRVRFLDVDLSDARGQERFWRDIERLESGDIVLLENVRFQKGETENSASLAAAYAAHGDVFINNAFASCHDAHASVVALANALPSYAGPELCEEVKALERLPSDGKKTAHPYMALIGGAKLSSKLPMVRALLTHADKVMVGGAMAHPFFVAKKLSIGKSYLEKESVPDARKLLNHKKLLLPIDAVVATKTDGSTRPRAVALTDIKKNEYIVDIGPQTMQAWAAEIRKAKTIIWNGPLGLTEVPAFSHGSLVVGRAIASRAKGPAYGVAGGGDTLPVVQATRMEEWFDFVSTGGGAMIAFIGSNGSLPGIEPLMGVQKKKMPKAAKTKNEKEKPRAAQNKKPSSRPKKAKPRTTKKTTKRKKQ